MFKDRTDAGRQLAAMLEKFKNNKNVLVLGIPRGGLRVAAEVAKILNVEFSIIIARKLPFPDNPESGFGAIAEDGSLYVQKRAVNWVTDETVKSVIFQQKIKLKNLVDKFRQGSVFPSLRNKIVILIDDGIAMGSTMRACINMCRKRKAQRIVVAVPVTGKRQVEQMRQHADEVVVADVPFNFRAVAQVYREWRDVPDEEALEIIDEMGI